MTQKNRNVLNLQETAPDCLQFKFVSAEKAEEIAEFAMIQGTIMFLEN